MEVNLIRYFAYGGAVGVTRDNNEEGFPSGVRAGQPPGDDPSDDGIDDDGGFRPCH